MERRYIFRAHVRVLIGVTSRVSRAHTDWRQCQRKNIYVSRMLFGGRTQQSSNYRTVRLSLKWKATNRYRIGSPESNRSSSMCASERATGAITRSIRAVAYFMNRNAVLVVPKHQNFRSVPVTLSPRPARFAFLFVRMTTVLVEMCSTQANGRQKGSHPGARNGYLAGFNGIQRNATDFNG